MVRILLYPVLTEEHLTRRESDKEAAPNPLNLFKTGPKGVGFTSWNLADGSPGTGPYPAGYRTDPTLPGHTIYAPKTPPSGIKIPVIVWGNGGCLDSGTFFQNFLTEIASHGFLILANGAPAPGGQLPASNLLAGLASGFGGIVKGATLISSVSEQARSIDWATTGGAGNGKYGDVDASKLAVAGQSCGGLESYSASYKEDRVKLTVLFDSGILSESKLPLLKELKAPVSYFLGGPKDIAYSQGERDYVNLPAGMPSVKCNIDAGHMGRLSQVRGDVELTVAGTYMSLNGGTFGKAATAFFKWQLKGDAEAKKWFLDPANSPLTKEGWECVSKGYQ